MDVLTWPVVGRFLKWRHARLALQFPLLLVAALVIFDGLLGPQLAPKNLATTSVWLHYRGLVVLALLLAGNLFCMACPFMLPRRAGRWLERQLRLAGHLRFGDRPFPAALRNKWLAIACLLIFFFAYERFSLWASPWLTAWIVLGYFLVATVIDTLFRGATFCKYICPLGQFNFFGSLVSPLEVKVREAGRCAECRTKDCIRGTSPPFPPLLKPNTGFRRGGAAAAPGFRRGGATAAAPGFRRMGRAMPPPLLLATKRRSPGEGDKLCTLRG